MGYGKWNNAPSVIGGEGPLGMNVPLRSFEMPFAAKE